MKNFTRKAIAIFISIAAIFCSSCSITRTHRPSPASVTSTSIKGGDPHVKSTIDDLVRRANFSRYTPKYEILEGRSKWKKMYNKKSKGFYSLKYKGINFRLYVPTHFDKNGKAALVTYYHGSGSHGNDNIKPIIGSVGLMTKDSFQKKHPCYIIVPQIPKRKSWTHQTLKQVIGLIREVRQAIPEIDQSRNYLMGHSLGGFGVCHTIKEFPRFFNAAVPMAGAIGIGYTGPYYPPTLAAYNAGEMDVIKKATKQLKRTFKQKGIEIIVKVFFFGGHKDTFRDVLKSKKLMDWLFSKQGPINNQSYMRNNRILKKPGGGRRA